MRTFISKVTITSVLVPLVACSSPEDDAAFDAFEDVPVAAGKADHGGQTVWAEGNRVYVVGEPAAELLELLTAKVEAPVNSNGLDIFVHDALACATVSGAAVCTFEISNPHSDFVKWFLIGDAQLQADWESQFQFGGNENPEAQSVYETIRDATGAAPDAREVETAWWSCQFTPEGVDFCGQYFPTACHGPQQTFCQIKN